MEKYELVFPCDYGIRVIGLDEDDFESFVKETVIRHIPDLPPEAFSIRPSGNNNYLSVSVSFCAESREQLDALYKMLGADTRVKVIL